MARENLKRRDRDDGEGQVEGKGIEVKTMARLEGRDWSDGEGQT